MLNKIPKLELIVSNDELRPVLCYVFVTKEKIAATNAHLLVQLDTNLIFDDEFISKIDKDGFFLSAKDWKIISSIKSPVMVWLDDDIISVFCIGKYGEKKSETLIKIKKGVGLYPKWEGVFPKEIEPVEKIGINPSLIVKLMKAVGGENHNRIEMFFHGANKVIVLKPSSELPLSRYSALIMPVILD